MTIEKLIEGLKNQERKAQRELYNRYAPVMFSVCRRYLSSREDAEEALVSGFYKVMTQINTYSGNGSLEGWIRRIMVNESLMMLRKKKPLHFPGDVPELTNLQDNFSIEAELSAREIMGLLDKLPNGYRTIFNLYVIEGYKHKEIADMLGISINTSKSQLILARERMKELVGLLGY